MGAGVGPYLTFSLLCLARPSDRWAKAGSREEPCRGTLVVRSAGFLRSSYQRPPPASQPRCGIRRGLADQGRMRHINSVDGWCL